MLERFKSNSGHVGVERGEIHKAIPPRRQAAT